MGGILDHRLVVVTGKGGVGKSTVAAALGLVAAGRGARTVVVEVARRADVASIVRSGGADHLSIDPEDAMEEYLLDQLPRTVAGMLASSRMFLYLAAATPGLRELLTAGKIWELAQDERRTPGAEPYDLVIVDAPATGHGLAVLAAPRTFAETARVGPIARQAQTIHAMLSDPAQTAVVAVTTPEELPVNETLYLRDALADQLGLPLSLVCANAVREPHVSRADAAALEPRREHPAVRAALSAHARVEAQRTQLRRLRRALDDEPVATLPFVPSDPADALARTLSVKL